MRRDIHFDSGLLEVLIGGRPVLDLSQLRIESIEQARGFVKSYGFNIDDPSELELLWGYHRRAILFAEKEILEPGEKLPELIADPKKLGDLTRLLILASARDSATAPIQRAACGLLKVMHGLVHLDSDLFMRFSQQIQEQILEPFEKTVFQDPMAGLSLGASGVGDSVALKKFEMKSFKSPDSSLLKLLIKPESIAFRILDKVGVRFVTKNIFDAFQVIRYLVKHNIISLPNSIPDQSNNSLFPLELFVQFAEDHDDITNMSDEQIDETLRGMLKQSGEAAKLNKKYNQFSDPDYRFIKFISRRLVQIKMNDQRPIHFFYPFEVQIMEYETYVRTQSGESSHDEYKKRQNRRARARVFGLGVPDGLSRG